jgi:hypothetical protein
MATNIIYDRIFKGLKLILGRRAIVRRDDAPKSADYILLSMESSPELLENTGATFAMRYAVNIDFITNRAKKSQYITQEISNILFKLNSNPAYTVGDVYYWHDMAIEDSDFGELLDDNDRQIYAGRILWTATHTECK